MSSTLSVLEQIGPIGPDANVGVHRALCLINGEWVEGEGELHDIHSPINGEVVSQVRYASLAQVDAAAKAARAAQKEWAAVPMMTKAKMMHAAADAVLRRGEEISRMMTGEMGKTIDEARHEVIYSITVNCIRAAAEDALRMKGSAAGSIMPQHPNRRVLTQFDPIGVGAFLSPWNFPAEMILNVAGALMMGNTTVWKPSEFSPYTPFIVTEAFMEAGFPPGTVNLIYGSGDIGENLVSHKEVGFVALIGSSVVGDKIARNAPMKRLMLECGGNGPLIVMDDADIDAAVEGAVVGCYYVAGQVCVASERILVHESVHDEFVEKLVAASAEVKVGNPFDEDTTMGPMINERILSKSLAHIADAKAKGATVVFGGGHDGLYHEPTVLINVTPDMDIAREETFGPVAPIIKFKDDQEALDIANDSQYGLQMAVFTKSLNRAWLFSEQLEAGVVVINRGNMDWDINAPFGGVKQSGLGRETGEEALRCFTNIKHLNINFL